jgi:hypothetical protein
MGVIVGIIRVEFKEAGSSIHPSIHPSMQSVFTGTCADGKKEKRKKKEEGTEKSAKQREADMFRSDKDFKEHIHSIIVVVGSRWISMT